jgi:hypothetical protein
MASYTVVRSLARIGRRSGDRDLIQDMTYCGNVLVVATGFSKHFLERGFDDLARARIGR